MCVWYVINSQFTLVFWVFLINLFGDLLEDIKEFFFFCLYVCAAFLQSKDSLG